jgi:hypothetical protein
MKAIMVILVLGVLFVIVCIAIIYYDRKKHSPDTFTARIVATVLGVLFAAVLSYGLWGVQQWQAQRAERKRVSTNLTDEIQANLIRLDELINYLAELEKWANTLESSDVNAGDVMICNDPNKGKHLKEIFPYRQVSFATEEAVSKGTITLFTEKLQKMLHQLLYQYHELNHRIDYCEKSGSDLIYTTALLRVSPQGRKKLVAYQARSVVRFLRKPAEDLRQLSNETSGFLDNKESK